MTDLGIPGLSKANPFTSGGSSVVYEAWQSDFDRHVAVKILRGPASEAAKKSFLRERQAAGRLSGHPGILDLYDGGVTDAGELFLIMPFIESGSLQDEVNRGGRFNITKAVNDVIKISEALHYAHSEGVIHRDIKPANILRSRNGEPLIADFGIARLMDTELSTTTVTAKTPLFAAPELLANGAATVASDVYGLAALLYALLAGRPAFAGGAASNIWAVMDRVRTEAPPAIDRVPQQVMEVIASAMAKNPNDRPATAKLFGQYLQFAMHEARNPQTDGPRTHARPPVLTHDPAAHTVDLVDAPPEPKRAGLPHRRQALPILASVATVLVVAFGIMQLLPGGSLDRNATGVDSVEAASTEVDATADAIVAGERIAPTAAPTARKTAESVSSDETPDASSEIDSSSAESEPTTSTSTPYATSRFAMQMPTGWSTVQENVDVGYGYRTHLVGPGGNFVIIDTTPHDRATPGVTIRQSAEQVAASVPSATSVVHEQIGNKDAYWFKYMGNDGSLRIDIFFTVDGDGYAVVGGSFSDPDSAYRIANDVVASLESRS